MKRSFIIIMTLVLGFGVAFWLRQLYQPATPALPHTIIVGTSADFPPMSFKKDGKIIGFDIDIVTEAVKRLGKKMVLKDMPFELLMPQIQLGTIQVVAAGMTTTPEREKRVNFTQPYLAGDPLVVLTMADKPTITHLEDLREKRIIVNQGYTADIYMSKLDDFALMRLPAVADALLALRSGKADAFVTASNTIEPLFQQYGQNEFKTFLIDDADENTALGISKRYPKLVEEFSDAIKQMHKDGTIKKLKQKWHVQ